MAESNELQSIVQALVTKTASGKLAWKLSRKGNPATDENSLPVINGFSSIKSDLGNSLAFVDAYYVSLGSGFVVMAKNSPEYDPDYLLLSFFDKQGNKAAEYKVEAGEPLWDDLFGWKSLVNELVG
jgi:hypothetical protein